MPNAEILGSWWLPPGPDEESDYQGPEDTVAGVLRLDESRPWQLTTIGNVDPDKPIHLFQQEVGLPEERAIWGASSEGESYSLLDPQPAGQVLQTTNPLQGTEQWGVRWYASSKGFWVTPKNTAERVHIRFNRIEDWVIDPAADSRAYFPTKRVLELPDNLSYSSEVQGSNLDLIVDSSMDADQRSFEARRRTTLKVDTPLRLEDVLENWLTPLSLLMDIVTGIPTTTNEILFEHAASPRLLNNLHYNMPTPAWQPRQNLGSLGFVAPLHVLHNFGLDFPALISNFFNLYESQRHRTALNHFSRSQSRIIDQSNDTELLNALRAIEQYHSEVMVIRTISAEELRRRIRAVKDAVSDEYRDWVEKELKGANKKSLREQVEEVGNLAATTTDRLNSVWPDFIREAVNLRHGIAHGNPTTKSDLHIRYHMLARALRWLLHHVYLLELGLSADATSELIQDSFRFGQDLTVLTRWHNLLS